ncbi:MAG: hypothetical protein BGO87_07845 [Flavobacteriia bacterium 40-80]|nr:MAG: hypothetical protein BGO87_07845 [Flavobacteriia bacterium 40-80]
MKHFLNLVRYKNLLIIALTMYSVLFFYTIFGSYFVMSFQEKIDFFLLVFSTVLIAAAGNIINDYFDVKSDRINKPEKLIITRHIKKRWAIVYHWTFNAVAFLIGCYLSFRYKTFWYVFIHLMSINILWFYSLQLKKISIIGNLLISLLTGIVPVLVGIHIHYHLRLLHEKISVNVVDLNIDPALQHFLSQIGDWWLIIFFFVFAFTLNFARELIKDAQDIEGDKLIHSRSLAIQIGEKNTRIIAGSILLLMIVLLTAIFWGLHIQDKSYFIQLFLPLELVLCLLVLAIFFLTRKGSAALKLSDTMIKISFLLGISLPFWWILFL